jgi:hypothetical protein
MRTIHLVLRGLSVRLPPLDRLLGPDLIISSIVSHFLLSWIMLFLSSFQLSTVAKVTRDRMNENWQFSEPLLEAKTNFGSGKHECLLYDSRSFGKRMGSMLLIFFVFLTLVPT